MKVSKARKASTEMLLMKFFMLTSVYSSRFGPSEPESGFSTWYCYWLLVLQRACLSTLLYKSIKRCAFFDFDITNVEANHMVSKAL